MGRAFGAPCHAAVMVLLTAAAATVQAQAQAPAAFPPQHMLDALAKPLPAGSRMGLPPTYPARFADWTEVQRKSGLQLIVQRCGLMIALEHDNPAARMLPPAMTMRDEAELASDVCLVAKMPADWPDRRKGLDDAQRLIAAANAAGGQLRLPYALSAK